MKMGYIITDSQNNFISNRCFTLTDIGWMYSFYTGITTGFTYYTNPDTAKLTLKKLQDLNDKYKFGKKFTLKHVDIKSIKKGEFNIIHMKQFDNHLICIK